MTPLSKRAAHRRWGTTLLRESWGCMTDGPFTIRTWSVPKGAFGFVVHNVMKSDFVIWVRMVRRQGLVISICKEGD